MTVLKWSMQYFHLEVDECDSVEDACRWVIAARDEGSESFQYIEVIEDGESRRITWDDEPLVTMDRERSAREQARAAQERPPVLALEVQSATEDEWARIYSFGTAAEAQADLDRLKSALGADRVRLRTIR